MADEQLNITQRVKQKQKKESPFEPKGFSGLVYSLLHDLAYILAAVTFLFIFFARIVGVSGSSMYPTLVGGEETGSTKSGDYLILKSNFLCGSYKTGDIVVACTPQFSDWKPIVKRVIAGGGQTVSFHKDASGSLQVYVDDVLLDEPYINRSPEEPIPMLERRDGAKDGDVIRIPEGYYFLMGDNRNHSLDSRYEILGLVDERFIVGKALWIAVPGADRAQGGKRDWSRFGDVYDN